MLHLEKGLTPKNLYDTISIEIGENHADFWHKGGNFVNSLAVSNKRLLGNFIRYVSFSTLGTLGMSLYILADTFFISHGLGTQGLTAVSLTIPVYNLLNGTGIMLGMGAATRYAILRGNRQYDKANRVFTCVMLLGIIFTMIYTICGLFFPYKIASLLGADSVIAPLSGLYLKVLLCLSFGFIFNNIIIFFVRNDGYPHLCTVAMILGCLGNILLAYLFVFQWKWGIGGLCLATCLSPIISLCVLSLHFIRRNQQFSLVRSRIGKEELFPIFSLGFPSFMTEFSSGIITMIFNLLILRLTGNIGVATYGIIANLALIVVGIFTGVGQGLQPIVSLDHGAGRYRCIRKNLRYGIVTAFIVGVVLYGFFFGLAKPIIAAFNPEHNAKLAQIGISGIRIYFSAFLLMGVNIVCTAFFASVSHAKFSFSVVMMRGLIAVVAFALILSSVWGMTGIWLTIPFTEVTTLILTIVFLGIYLKEIRNQNDLSDSHQKGSHTV